MVLVLQEETAAAVPEGDERLVCCLIGLINYKQLKAYDRGNSLFAWKWTLLILCIFLITRRGIIQKNHLLLKQLPIAISPCWRALAAKR
jgi:hypothetical protein